MKWSLTLYIELSDEKSVAKFIPAIVHNIDMYEEKNLHAYSIKLHFKRKGIQLPSTFLVTFLFSRGIS